MRTAVILLCVGFGFVAHAEEYSPGRLAELATVKHKEAQQTKDPKKLEEAAALYERYFAKPDDKEGVMAYYYGELLFTLQRYAKAAELYERSVAVDPKGRFVREAVYAAMIARNDALAPSPRDGGPTCPGTAPCAIPADRLQLVADFDLYLRIAPASPERASVAYRKARVYYEYNHFAEAAPLFERVVVDFPTNELAIYSANQEMDCLASLKRYGELRALVERVQKNPAMMSDAVLQQNVRDVEAQLKQKGK